MGSGGVPSEWTWSASEDALVVKMSGADTFAVYDVLKGTKRFVATAPGILREFGFSLNGSSIWMTTDDAIATFDAHTGVQQTKLFVGSQDFTRLWTSDGSTVVIPEGRRPQSLDGATLNERWRTDARRMICTSFRPIFDRYRAQ